MVALRNLIDVETFDFSVLAKIRQPSALGLTWNDADDTYPQGVWSYDDYFTEEQSDIEANLQNFFEYASYPNKAYYLFTDYNFTTDPTSPLAFIP